MSKKESKKVLTIEMQLRRIKSECLIDEFKRSKDLILAPGLEGKVLRDIVFRHDWSQKDSWDDILASLFRHDISLILGLDMFKTSEEFDEFADKIIQILDTFMKKKPEFKDSYKEFLNKLAS